MNCFAILPAAGRSRRMGQPKLLMPWGSFSTILEATVATWAEAGVDEILVVTHPDDNALQRVVLGTQAQLVIPGEVPREMKISIREGLRWWKAHREPSCHDAWLLAPADMPLFSPAVVAALITNHLQCPETIVVPRHAGRRGHPVLFPWPLAEEVEQLGESEGVNILLQRCPVKEIDFADSSILEDVDTPDDYQRLRPRGPT